MKTQPEVSKTATLEDIVFEGRNKSYGAYELNNKRMKYLFIAFLICFTGISTAIAVPFLNALRTSDEVKNISITTTVVLTKLNQPKTNLDPPPPIIEMPKGLAKAIIYVPVIVENAVEEPGLIIEDVIAQTTNNPVDLPDFPVPDNLPKVIDDPDKETILFPQEAASFNGCTDPACFHKWVSENIVYPAIAVEVGIKGKVIVQFCVNSKGEVVDVQIVKRLDPAIDAETVRVIKSSPLWAPARQGGRPVKTMYTIPFTFDLI